MVIYVDILFCYNLLVHFCLLSSTAALCIHKCRRYRLLLGCILGSLYSFAIFFTFSAAEFMLLKALMAASLILVTFGFGSILLFCKRIFLFLCVNLVYAGAMLLIAFAFAPEGMIYRSGVAYFGGGTWDYVLGLLLGYGLLRGFVWYIARRRGGSRHQVLLRCGERRVQLSAYYDSGNRLVDLYSGRPVLVLAPSAAEQLLPPQLYRDFAAGEMSEAVCAFGHKAHLLPMQTVSGGGMLISFVPDEIRVDGREQPDWAAAVAKDVLQCNAEALLPSSF